MNDQTTQKEDLPTLEIQQRLALFGQEVLSLLSGPEEPTATCDDYLDEIVRLAEEYKLRDLDHQGYFKATQEALGAELEDLHFSEFMDLFGLCKIIGDGFHPDTPMADYVDREGNRTFGEQETDVLQEILDNCHRVFGDAIYGLANEMCRSEGELEL